MPERHVYADAQFPIGARAAATSEAPARCNRLALTDTRSEIRVKCGEDSMAIDRRSGLLSSIRLAGKELLLSPLTPNFRSQIEVHVLRSKIYYQEHLRRKQD